MAGSLVEGADAVQLEADAVEPEFLPQRGAHDDEFRIRVRSGKAQRLGAELVELAVASLLRALVAVHRPRVPEADRPVVGEAVLDRRTHRGGRGLGAQRELLAVQPILERVHLLLDDVGDFADRAPEEAGMLEQWRADVAVPVAMHAVAHDLLEGQPAGRLVGEHVVHATDGLQGCGHLLKLP